MSVSYAHLLIVDADEQRRQSLSAPFQQRQWYTTSQAADLPAAEAIWREEMVDVVLVDVALAHAGEQAFLRALREFDTENRIRTLLIVPAGSEELVREAIAAGANDWLYFPADPALLKLRCDLAIQQINLQQQLSTSLEDFKEMMRLADNLREHTTRLRVLQEELRIARQIQSGFFPAELPQPAGWELAAHLRPAREVGGDFYDVFSLPDGRVGLVVADVVGKGVGAALFMSLVRTLVRSAIERDVQEGWNGSGPAPSAAPSLTRTVAFTNHYLMAHHAQDHMFATLFIGIVNPQTGELSYVNAGHVPPLLFRRGEERPTRLSRSGPAMGLVQEAEYRMQQEMIAPGDWLLVFTDGVTDARNPAGESFGQARLEQVLAQEPAGAQQLLQELDGRIAAFSQQEEPWDDVTMLALHRSRFGELPTFEKLATLQR